MRVYLIMRITESRLWASNTLKYLCWSQIEVNYIYADWGDPSWKWKGIRNTGKVTHNSVATPHFTAVPILIKVECNRIFSAYLNIISGCILKRNVQEVLRKQGQTLGIWIPIIPWNCCKYVHDFVKSRTEGTTNNVTWRILLSLYLPPVSSALLQK
jgi:hypothetical protein